jgi:uncharacterized protein YggE
MLAACSAAAQQQLSVTGDAEIKVIPDQVVITLGVEVHSKVLTDARRENDTRVRSVRAAASALGVQDSDIQTDYIQLGMHYEPDGITTKYFYSRKSIVLTVRDIARMEEILAAAVDAGATHIHDVTFETTKLREHRDRARALAVKAATEKAHDMAAAAGLKVVGGPIGISSSSYGSRSWYGSGWGGHRGMLAQNVYVEAGAGSRSEAQSAVALGRISVTASVSMQFAIQ